MYLAGRPSDYFSDFFLNYLAGQITKKKKTVSKVFVQNLQFARLSNSVYSH